MAQLRKYWILFLLALFLLPETARDIHFIFHHLNHVKEMEHYSGVTIVADNEACPFSLIKFIPRIDGAIPFYSFNALIPVIYLKFEGIDSFLSRTIIHYRLRGPPNGANIPFLLHI